MTMKLRITNEEAPGGHTARVRFYWPATVPGNDPIEDSAAAVTLAPGEGTDAYVHLGRFLRVEEVARTTEGT